MSIRTIHARRGLVVKLTILPLFLFLLQIPEEALGRPQEEPRVRNVNLEIREDIAIITYDLLAPSDGLYEISAVLVKEGDPSFRIPLRSVSGDMGRGRFAGARRQIQWEWRKDLPKTFTGGSEYSVEVSATQVDEGGGGTWVYYVLGGALIAGGTVALVASKKSSSGSSLPSTPPGRPF